MALWNFSPSATKPNGPDATCVPKMGDAFQLAGALLDQQQQMLGFISLAADTLRLMLRQSQRQMEYMSALSRCRDGASIAALTAEFAQTMSQEGSQDWQELARLAERWMAATNPNTRRREDRPGRPGLGPDPTPNGSGSIEGAFAEAWPDPLRLMRLWSGEAFIQPQPPWRQ